MRGEGVEEGEAVWASLFSGYGPSERLYDAWAEGLGFNRAAPDDVLCRLLGVAKGFLWRTLPTAVVDAAVAHPDWPVRGQLAESQPDMTAEQWSRLLLGEPAPNRRYVLAMLAADRRAPLTDAAYERLAADSSARVRAEVTRLPGLPVPLLTALVNDLDPGVRAAACSVVWPQLDAAGRQRLLADPEHKVRVAALLRHHEKHSMPRSVFDAVDGPARAMETCRLDRALAEELSVHDDPAVRRALARNPHLAPDLVAVLAEDTDDDVRFQVSVRPELSEEQRGSVRFDLNDGRGGHALPWVVALHRDPEAMRRCAASEHPLLRRSVARARRLPPDVVDILARDEDRVVRLFLAESCDDAPADMLLGVWQWWTGSFSYPGRPRNHPNFPRHGLLRHADDPDPRMRQLALDDPESTAELVELFSRDTEDEVRLRAATDPRLSAASAVRLLDDPQPSVRSAAVMHPRLPAGVLVRLLLDTDSASDAARNPAVPVSLMHQMIDSAGN